MEFVLEIENSLSEDFCKKVITLFEQEPTKAPAHCIAVENPNQKEQEDTEQCLIPPDVQKLMKTTIGTDFSIPSPDQIHAPEEWKAIWKTFNTALKKGFQTYMAYLQRMYPYIQLYPTDITGFKIQKTDPGQRFLWHEDTYIESSRHRIVSYIWYLNTLSPEECGDTMFTNRSVRPVAGKLMFFPATWTYWHYGSIPKNTKYICAGFIHSDNHHTLSNKNT